MDIKKYGSYLKIEESPETRLDREKEMFMDIIDSLIEMSIKEQILVEQFKVDLTQYVDDHYVIIESLIYMKFGPVKGRVILWYIYERIDSDGNIGKLTINDDDKKTSESFILNNSEELWTFLQNLKNNEEKL